MISASVVGAFACSTTVHGRNATVMTREKTSTGTKFPSRPIYATGALNAFPRERNRLACTTALPMSSRSDRLKSLRRSWRASRNRFYGRSNRGLTIMPCAFGCNMCNRCGKFTELLAQQGRRFCPNCKTAAPDGAAVCPECGRALPPPFERKPGVASVPRSKA